MNKKFQLPLIGMLGISVLLLVMAYGTYRQTQNNNQSISPTASHSHASSHISFFQYLINMLENMIGLGNQNNSSNENNILDQSNPLLPTGGHVSLKAGYSEALSPSTLPTSQPLNMKATQGTFPTADQSNNAGNNAASQVTGPSPEQITNTENNPEINPGNNPGTTEENNQGSDLNNNAENNPENNSEANTGNNAENNSEDNAQNNSGQNSDQETGNLNSGDNTGSNSGPNSDQGSGGTGSNQGPGNLSGGGSGNNGPGNGSGNYNQKGFAPINPIPPDNVVSQSIVQQNQRNNALAALLAARQALVLPVQQQAQASKYQTVESQNIPSASANQPPADAVAKMKSNQVVYR